MIIFERTLINEGIWETALNSQWTQQGRMKPPKIIESILFGSTDVMKIRSIWAVDICTYSANHHFFVTSNLVPKIFLYNFSDFIWKETTQKNAIYVVF
jgi:hypothetical protein